MLEHGGGLIAAARRYGIPREQWLDLSTGLNPQGWLVPALPASCWQRLPEEHDGLEAAAADYYGSVNLLPVAGSQAAIQALPLLRPAGRVGVLSTSYAEHAHAWQRHGLQVMPLEPDAIDAALPTLDVLLLVNPNNPTGQRFSVDTLQGWRATLAERGGWLIVDEAFMDCTPEESLVPQAGLPGLIVLRSLGKFFGLAGARVGFVFAWSELLDALREELGPWTLAGPARAAARLALLDTDWQVTARQRLAADGTRLAALLAEHGLTPTGGTPLFQWLQRSDAQTIHEVLARRGILTRHFAAPASVRFGLPPDEAGWQRLAEALAELRG
ncbi:threonine-phosphate decarboxylase CobD [Crenobacter sp. SG2303]|uniref:Putative 8-amino-7-oxononanoate synthase n=1 Tax=Crenobacter oryzisoli TaxID=3056844 RepID=A0ABT7XNH9_9NEIS|nr:threonine-phosphate decarboxylase CobD [Crenobacter sp. SG2303]MDN0075358.1 threonine-phosphate decarboxylase CobD [Crenobacter sp. SG2303]